METDLSWRTLMGRIRCAVLLLSVIVGTLLVGGEASADVTQDQYCRAMTVTAAPIKDVPSDGAPARYVVPPGTSLWVAFPAVNNYLRVPDTPPYPSKSGWVRENNVRILSCTAGATTT